MLEGLSAPVTAGGSYYNFIEDSTTVRKMAHLPDCDDVGDDLRNDKFAPGNAPTL